MKTLTFPEMKQIKGGYDYFGTCGYWHTGERVRKEEGIEMTEIFDRKECGVSLDIVNMRMNSMETGDTFWWCCDSCPGTDYCG